MRLFGDDIFISYAHRDAGEYALALVARLSKRYAVYVDRVGSKAGEKISDKVLQHLMNASMLIVIVSQDATRADSKVREEVELFSKTERPILAIDIGGALKQCAWGTSLHGLSVATASSEDFAKHRPSPGVRRSVEQTRKYWTRTNRLLAIAASIIIVTIGVVAVAWRQVDRATREVAGATREMQRQQTAASALRLANLATTAWQQQRTPVDDVLLVVAESLRRGATPSALQLAVYARALRPKFVTQLTMAGPDKTRLQDGTLFTLDKNQLRVLDLSTQQERHVTLPCAVSEIDTFLPSEVEVYCTGGDVIPYRVDLSDLSISRRPSGRPIERVWAAGPLADAFVVGHSYVIELRDRKSGRPLIQIPLGWRSCQKLHFSGDGRVLGAVTLDQAGANVLLFDVPSGKLLGQLTIGRNDPNDEVVAINHDGSAVAVMSAIQAGFASGTVMLALRQGEGRWKEAWQLPFRNAHGKLAFAGEGVMFLDDNVIRIVGTGLGGEPIELRRIITGQRPEEAMPLANGEVALTTGDRITLWRVAPIPAPGGLLMAIDATASRIALWHGQTAIVRDLASGMDVFRHKVPGGYEMVLDAGGRRVVIGVRGGSETYDVASGDLLAVSHEPLPWDTPAVTQCCVSADRQRTAKVESVGEDLGSRVLLIDAATKRPTLEIVVPDGFVTAFRPGTRELLVVGTAGNVMTLDDDPLHVATAICREVGHSLSRERWSQLINGEPWVDTCAEVGKSSIRQVQSHPSS